MNISQLLQESALKYRDRPALISGLGRGRNILSFEQLNSRVSQMCCDLRGSGLRPGDRVLLAVPISIDTYVALIAALQTGLVVMFVDPGHGIRNLSYALRSYPPAAVIARRGLFNLARWLPELRHVSRWLHVPAVSTKVTASPSRSTIEPRHYSDSALLSFTSGSTGQPKAVIRTHGFLQEQLSVLQKLAMKPGQGVELVSMPMFVLCNLANGIASVLPACDIKQLSRVNIGLLVRQLHQEEATSLLGAPALLEQLILYVADRGWRLPFLTNVATGGGPVALDLQYKLSTVAPNCQLRIVYGSTEAEPISTLLGSEIKDCDQRLGATGSGLLVGRHVAGCDLRVIADKWGEPLGDLHDEAFDRLTMANGKIGELVVSGKHVLESYLDSESTRFAKFNVGKQRWHRTGDSGYIDDHGRVWLTGRCSAALRDTLGVVYPFQVELPVMALEGVRKAALLSVGGIRVLVVEIDKRSAALRRILASAIIRDARIDHVAQVRRIPMDRRHNSKVDYPALHDMLDGQWFRYRIFIGNAAAEISRLLAKIVAQVRFVLTSSI